MFKTLTHVRTHMALAALPGSGSVSGTNSVMCVMGSVVHLKALVNTGSQELAAAGGPSATHLLYPLPVGAHIKHTIR